MIYRITGWYHFSRGPPNHTARLHVQSDAPGSWSTKPAKTVDISTINLSSPYPVGPSPCYIRPLLKAWLNLRFSLCHYFWGRIFVRLSWARFHPGRYPMLEKSMAADLPDLGKWWNREKKTENAKKKTAKSCKIRFVMVCAKKEKKKHVFATNFSHESSRCMWLKPLVTLVLYSNGLVPLSFGLTGLVNLS